MKHKNKSILTIACIILGMFICIGCDDDDEESGIDPMDLPYEVEIDPLEFIAADFTGNLFFPLIPGTKFRWEGENENGEFAAAEDTVTFDTRQVMGVTCIVVECREWEAGELVEETWEWYAQDTTGNVWHFGEESHEIERTAGSWEAGLDGALPGILMLANPVEGLWYRQEYWEGEAEDVAQILSVNAEVSVSLGEYENCLQTAEWTALESDVVEHKFYAPGVGMVRAVTVEGAGGYEDLVEITDP